MTTRTFKQFGQAYGPTTASIVAKIDGTTVYSGNVTTLDEPIPVFDGPEGITNELFTWTSTVDFVGTQTLSIEAIGQDIQLADTQANYGIVPNPSYDPEVPGSQQFMYGGAGSFSGFYNVSSSGDQITDPLSNVQIDGVDQTPTRNGQFAQWYWVIPAGSTLTATINIQAGFE